MPMMPDCVLCSRYEKLEKALKEAAETELWPWNEILKGQLVLFQREMRDHSGSHCIKSVVDED